MPTMTITLNLRKRLLKVHMPLRRRRISTDAREAIARFAKADIEKIRFDSNLNRHLILRIARKPVKFKVTVDGVTKTLTTDGGTDSLTWTGLVNNTYAYSISGVPGYHQSTLPPSGTVVVAGTSVTEPTIVYT